MAKKQPEAKKVDLIDAEFVGLVQDALATMPEFAPRAKAVSDALLTLGQACVRRPDEWGPCHYRSATFRWKAVTQEKDMSRFPRELTVVLTVHDDDGLAVSAVRPAAKGTGHSGERCGITGLDAKPTLQIAEILIADMDRIASMPKVKMEPWP